MEQGSLVDDLVSKANALDQSAANVENLRLHFLELWIEGNVLIEETLHANATRPMSSTYRR
jgi:hypothetical protein